MKPDFGNKLILKDKTFPPDVKTALLFIKENH